MTKWKLERLSRNKPFYQWLSANTAFEKNNALEVWKKMQTVLLRDSFLHSVSESMKQGLEVSHVPDIS